MTAHLTAVKMPITKKQKVTGVVDVGAKRTFVHCWWECKMM